ncbi:hypothetical protein [Petroclostridium xylanilyticum]|uniref:hypothetical protein n=1 Tax=Petroclostridium xylanilyticum TaxID=1792311 RepID=UPI000B996AE8|nr:hypothetical protein [Petroclostridium xylanilyticum]
MIYKDIQMVDFEPYRWRNLGEVLDLGKYPRTTLYILHENGTILNAYDTVRGIIKNIKSPISNEAQLVQELFEQYKDLQEIHIYDKQSLENFNIQAQKSAYPDLDGDEYRNFVRKLLKNYKGLNIYSKNREPKKDFYDDMVYFVENQLPDKSVVFIGIFKDNALFFEVIWGLNKGKAELVTTLDVLHQYNLETVTMTNIDTITQLLRDHFQMPAYTVFIDYQAYERLFTEWDKEAFIMKAIAQDKIKYRVTDDINPNIIPTFIPGFIDIFRRLTYNS